MNSGFKATRFAPSPTGPLHFGSLVCAIASYLFARQNGARWLLRIEDIDQQRCHEKYVKSIIDCLHAHGLKEDGEILHQSQRGRIYEQYIEKLREQQLVYACDCSRKTIKQRANFYDGFCRNRHLSEMENALRYKNLNCPKSFTDLHFGNQLSTSQVIQEDPVLKRADGQYNYNLAVIADDIEQEIDLIVRGADLLDQTPLHQQLFSSFNAASPAYLHIPMAAHKFGVKYAKQSFSPAIDNTKCYQNVIAALIFIGFSRESIPEKQSTNELLDWAADCWNLSMLKQSKEIVVELSNGVYSPQSV